MNKQELLEKYKFKLEMHAHTNPVSSCSQIPVEDFADIFIEDGFDGVCVTNHFTPVYLEYESVKKVTEYYMSDFKTVKEKAGDKLSVILGMEVRFTENINDYLVFGIGESDIEKVFYYLDKGIDCFYREFKNDKNVILHAHPFRDGMSDTNPKSLDGIEVFNFHPGHNSRIAVASDYAQKENFKIVAGGLDFHHMYQRNLFSMRTAVLPKDSYEFAQILKSGEYVYVMGNSIILP